jgi:hypothetical protein
MKSALLLVTATIASAGPDNFACAQPVGRNDSHITADELRYSEAYDMVVRRNGGLAISPLMVSTLDRQLKNAFASDPVMKKREDEYPGLVNYVVDKMMPVWVKQINDDLPKSFAEEADYYAVNMTLSDIKAAKRFFGRPEFTRIREKLAGSVDFSALIDTSLKDPDKKMDITVDRMKGLQKGAASNALAELTPAERKLITSFNLSATGQQLIKLHAGALAIQTKWSNQSTPEENKELGDVVSKAMDEFIGQGVAE